MVQTQLKLLLFLVALGITAGCAAVAYWIFEKELRREMKVTADLQEMQKNVLAPPDPGARRFDAAIDLIKNNKIDEGRDALYKLLQQFPESPTCVEARRIIGEINFDGLFSPNQMAGKKDYIVQPGDSLALIANKNQTNVDTIIRMNGLIGNVLHPGDHLIVVPLNFDVVVDVSSRTVALLRTVGTKQYFFKQYQAFDVRLPPNTRVPAEMEIGVKQALVDGKGVVSTDPRYIEAEKWVPGTKPGVFFRTVPVAKAVVVVDEARPKAKGAAAPEQPVALETGVFMVPEDLEELFALVRKGSKLRFVR
jgi:LysM domain